MQEKIFELISDATKKDLNSITLQSSFVDDLELDSLDIVELLMKLEDELGVEIPESDAEGMKTVEDIVNYVKTHKPQ